MTLANAIWSKRAAHDLKKASCTIFIESAVFSRFEENIRPVWRFWELWRSKMRFGQNVLRMTSKERFVEFWWKAHYFSVLKGIWGQCDDFENFDAPKCDLGKTCSAWPEKSVLYTFHRKRTVFPFSAEFQARMTILKTLTLQNAIWRNRPAHNLKSAFCTIWYEERTVFPFWREFKASFTILKTLTLKNAIWPKRAPYDLKKAFCQFSWKVHCFHFLKRIWG